MVSFEDDRIEPPIDGLVVYSRTLFGAPLLVRGVDVILSLLHRLKRKEPHFEDEGGGEDIARFVAEGVQPQRSHNHRIEEHREEKVDVDYRRWLDGVGVLQSRKDGESQIHHQDHVGSRDGHVAERQGTLGPQEDEN